VHYNQIEFSLSKPEALTNGSLDHMQESGIRPMAWAPLGAVFKQSDPAATRILSLAGELGEKYSVSTEAILLAWILRHPAAILPVFGSTEPTRITRLQQATKVKLELQDWFRLWAAATGKEVP
jgi:predicted oxidoreductase